MTCKIVDKMIGTTNTAEKLRRHAKKIYRDKHSKDQYIMVAGTPVSINRP